MITVVIPTANRPRMLRQAIRSVAAQTARARISRVLVSENGGNAESRAVCAEFPGLPIEYVFHDPPVTAVEHGRILLTESLGEGYAAILHDDDWWCPQHLAGAVQALDSDPNIAAVFSNHIETEGPSRPGWLPLKTFHVWVASGGDFSEEWLVLNPEKVMLAVLLEASFHYSTCVGRTKAIGTAYQKVVDSGNAYDNDRTFAVFLAVHGNLAYLTFPDIFVRLHPQNDFRRYSSEQEAQLKNETTKWLHQAFPKVMAGAIDRFNRSPLADRDIESVSNITPARREFLIDHYRLKLKDYRPRLKNNPTLWLGRQILRQLCPPLIVFGARYIRRQLRGLGHKPAKS